MSYINKKILKKCIAWVVFFVRSLQRIKAKKKSCRITQKFTLLNFDLYTLCVCCYNSYFIINMDNTLLEPFLSCAVQSSCPNLSKNSKQMDLAEASPIVSYRQKCGALQAWSIPVIQSCNETAKQYQLVDTTSMCNKTI
jgi:hypothetical protein